MSVITTKKISKNKEKIWHLFEWGKNAGQRVSSGIFTYNKPKDQLQRNHNKEALAILDSKKSQMILDQQAVNSGHIPHHKLKHNFLDYYSNYIWENRSITNRHLLCSLAAFKKFLGKEFISAIDITENLCERFRDFLVRNYNGETPAGYFTRFKKMLRAAKKDGYFRVSPAQDIPAKTNKNKRIKQILTELEYAKLMQAPCLNHEVKKAFVFSLYTGLRWADVKPMTWDQIQNDYVSLIQHKTGVKVDVPLHPTALAILGIPKSTLVFQLPTHEGANKILKQWVNDAGVNKHITWHSARHSFSVLLQDKGTDLSTVAGMLGHTTTKYVEQTYRRYNKSNAIAAISNYRANHFALA